MKKIALILVVFAFLVYCPSAGQSQEVGDNAPDFSLVDASGNEIKYCCDILKTRIISQVMTFL